MRDSLALDPRSSQDSLVTNLGAGDSWWLRHQRFHHRAVFILNQTTPIRLNRHRGLVACAWQANTTSDTTSVRVDSDGNGSVIIEPTGGANQDGWVHLLTGGTNAPREEGGVTPVVPIAKGQPGYVPIGWIYRNHRSAAPNTLTGGRPIGTKGLRFQVFPFTLSGDASDRWRTESQLEAPGVVAVAWQCDLGSQAGHRVAVTLDAAGDVIFTPDSVDARTGWLWTWRRY